jgi:hypothetical protein
MSLTDFIENGLDIEQPLFRKLWVAASIQGHFNPWRPELLELNELQLDAILEAYSSDYPKKLKFERRKSRLPREQTETLAIQWSDKLTGKAREQFQSKVSFKLPDQFKSIRQRADANVHKMPRKRQ